MMRHRLHIVAAVITGIGLVLPTVATLWAAPVEVTLFPEEARVLETTTVSLKPSAGNRLRASILLPPQADPASVLIRPPLDGSLRILDYTCQPAPESDGSRSKTLEAKLQNTRKERSNLQGSLQSLEAQLQFWQLQTKAKAKTVTDAGTLATTLGRNIKRLWQERQALKVDLERVEGQLKALEESEGAARSRRKAWNLSILLSGPPAGSASLTYAYTLSGCGWKSLYRIEARPLEKRILFSWDAEVWQESGLDWQGVTLKLADLRPAPALAPPDLAPWPAGIRKEAAAPKEKARKGRKKDTPPAEVLPAAYPTANPAFPTLQSLGKRNLPSGGPQHLTLTEASWPADFSYLIRPRLSPLSFLQGAVRLPEAQDLPSGNALFLKDGTVLGKDRFSLSGKTATIFFGPDPAVTARTISRSHPPGKKRPAPGKQIHEWDWQIDVRNAGGTAVHVFVEEPLPRIADGTAPLTVRGDPEPTRKNDGTLTWQMDLAAGETRSIQAGITLEGPLDGAPDPGP